MPVCITPFNLKANVVQGRFATDILDVARGSFPDGLGKRCEVIQDSFADFGFPTTLLPARNGLVDSVITAYNNHHHLRIRPEDVWFAILTQFSFFVNANAEALRRSFVAHQGKKTLTLEYAPFNAESFDFGIFAKQMGGFLEQHVTDPKLREWILPNFTTTEEDDIVVASIIMMSTLKSYFNFECRTSCGIPSVTLLGEKSDYLEILTRLDKLETFGHEPAQFGALLKPVVKRMVQTFANPHHTTTLRFWKQVLDIDSGSGFRYYSGWIVAFCFWDEKGKCLYSRVRHKSEGSGISLDGVKFHVIDSSDVPSGSAKVPVTVEDRSREFMTEMVAGSIGITALKGESSTGLDTVQPATGWWMYEIKNKP